jgi:HPt (histidine-containing phosphotransfer) domain-containing protein
MNGTPLIDPAILDDMVEHIGCGALLPVIALFLDESHRQAADIVAAAASSDGRETVRRTAHSLKSSAGQLGAALLAEHAAALERAAASGEPLVPLAATLSDCAAATAAAFGERLKAPPG